MSQVFWALAAHNLIILPVSPTGTCWWTSLKACVSNLIHMAAMDSADWSAQRSYQMPVLYLGVDEVEQALAQRFSADARALVSYRPDPFIDSVFASYPALTTPRAEAIGLRNDESLGSVAVSR